MLVGLRELVILYDGLRYSLVPSIIDNKYIERWGINDHEVKVNVEFRPASECYITTAGTTTTPVLTSASLYADYVFLDTDERRQFAQVAHKILCKKVTKSRCADTFLIKNSLYSARSIACY
jgi:hypothetical protein